MYLPMPSHVAPLPRALAALPPTFSSRARLAPYPLGHVLSPAPPGEPESDHSIHV